MKKILFALLPFVFLSFCSCINNHIEITNSECYTTDVSNIYAEIPDDFNVEYARNAVANYYLHNFIMIDINDIIFLGFIKETNSAEFIVDESVKELIHNTDLKVGKFYVSKSDGQYYARIENSTMIGTYHPA